MARLPTFLARIVGLVLCLSPRDFRARFGPEIVAMFTFWGRGMSDVLKTAAHERRIADDGWFGRGSPWSDLGSDVKYALRGWRRSPGFSLTVVTTLALGLGLASAIFAFADGYLFRPLPFPACERAYMVRDPNDPVAGALRASDVVALRQSAVADFGFVEWSAGHLDGDLVLSGRRIPIWNYDVSLGFRQTRRASGSDRPRHHAQGRVAVSGSRRPGVPRSMVPLRGAFYLKAAEGRGHAGDGGGGSQPHWEQATSVSGKRKASRDSLRAPAP